MNELLNILSIFSMILVQTGLLYIIIIFTIGMLPHYRTDEMLKVLTKIRPMGHFRKRDIIFVMLALFISCILLGFDIVNLKLPY